MSVITRIRAWRDPGFSEDGPQAPHVGYTLPDTNLDLQGLSLRPSASRTFSELKIRANWPTWRPVCFLEITYEWNAGSSPQVYYGWVDSVDLLSDTVDGGQWVSVRIRWHVDSWMTWLSQAFLGPGHILRRPPSASGGDPIQGYEHRFWEIQSAQALTETFTVNGRRTWWVLIAAGATAGSHKYIQYLAFPFDAAGMSILLQQDAQHIYPAPEICDITGGMWDEMLGLDPQAIYGIWIVPFPPMDPSNLNVSGQTVSITGSTGWGVESKGIYAALTTGPQPYYDRLFHSHTGSLPEALISTELNPLRVSGFQGEPLGEIPVGRSVNGYSYRIVASATECYVEVRFNGWQSRTLGTCFTVPALPLDVTENAWSSYQYSGQREYDIDARNNESIRSGIQAIASGGSAGAIMGGFTPAGALAGAAAGAMGGVATLGTDLLWYNEATQGLKDKLASRQSPGILIPGGALDAVFRGQDISLLTMRMDYYSRTRAQNERDLSGVKVDEYAASNNGIKSLTGFYQIANQEVHGWVPPEAKRAIANRFAKGVRLI